MTLFVGAFGFIAMVVAGLLAMFSSNDLPSSIAQDTKLPSAQLRAASKPAAAKAGDSERVSASGDDFSRKVSDLKAAGNWNVLVLYAVEWTRKAPTNADAWNELSMGYAKLRQFNEARAATKRRNSRQKRPGVAKPGRDQRGAAAAGARLSAYQQAVLLTEDVASLVGLAC